MHISKSLPLLPPLEPLTIMASFQLISLLCLALAQLISAHFIVLTPPPLGTNIDNEDTAPCGGYTPSSSDTLTDFHVGGDAIGLDSLHPQSYFSFQGQLGISLSPANWTTLIPTIEQFGLSDFCEPSIAVPASWAGSSGLLQVIEDTEDGVHYQVCRQLPPVPAHLRRAPFKAIRDSLLYVMPFSHAIANAVHACELRHWCRDAQCD